MVVQKNNILFLFIYIGFEKHQIRLHHLHYVCTWIKLIFILLLFSTSESGFCSQRIHTRTLERKKKNKKLKKKKKNKHTELFGGIHFFFLSSYFFFPVASITFWINGADVQTLIHTYANTYKISQTI